MGSRYTILENIRWPDIVQEFRCVGGNLYYRSIIDRIRDIAIFVCLGKRTVPSLLPTIVIVA
jgi:hypothetical protein